MFLFTVMYSTSIEMIKEYLSIVRYTQNRGQLFTCFASSRIWVTIKPTHILEILVKVKEHQLRNYCLVLPYSKTFTI